jgi:hypothetical protein
LDGKTFSRQLSQYFTVHPAIDFKGTNPGGNLIAFSAHPVNLKLNVSRSNIKLEFTYNNGTTETEEMQLVGQGYWEKIIPVSADDNVKVRAKLIGMTQTGLRFDYWTPFWHFNRKGDEAPTVGLDDVDPTSMLLMSIPSSNRDLMPVMVLPAVSVVNEVEEDGELSSEPDAADIQTSDVDKAVEKTDSLSKTEWMMYIGLNLGGILIIAAGIFLYRRMQKNKSLKSDDTDDV